MTELSAQEKLDKIEAQNRERAARYLENQRKEGKQPISGIITMQAYEELCRRRDAARDKGQSLTTGDILSQAIMDSITEQAAQLNADISQTLDEMREVLAPLEGVVDFDGIIEPENIDVNIDDIPDRSNKKEYRAFLHGVFKTLEIELPDTTWDQKAEWCNEKGILSAMGKQYSGNTLRMAVKNDRDAKESQK